jgi:phage shock protein E
MWTKSKYLLEYWKGIAMNSRTIQLLIASLAFSLVALAAVDLHAADAPTTQKSGEQAAQVKKITLTQLEKMKADKDAVVLDVRTPKEFEAGHIPGAVNIDWHARDFADRVAKLDKSKPYLIHCQAGVRSAAAAKAMSKMDFLHLYDYSGGFAEYSKSGQPVEK